MGFWKIYLIRIVGTAIVALWCGLAYGQNTLKVQSVQSGPNEMVVVQVLISNDTPFLGFQFDLTVPEVLKLKDPSAKLSERANNHSMSLNEVSANTIRVVVFSISQSVFGGNSGTVVTLYFESGTVPDTYSLDLSDGIIADTNQQNILDEMEDGTYTLLAPDINSSSNNVDFGEVPLGTTLSRNVQISNQGNTPLSIQNVQVDNSEFIVSGLGSGDVVGAGESVNLTISFSPSDQRDSEGVITIQSDDPDEPEITITVQAHTFAVNELHVGTVKGENGEIVTIPVTMNNMSTILGAEIKITLPEIADYVEGSVQLTERKDDHQISANVSGNQLHIISFSSSNAVYFENEGTLFEFQLELTGQRGSYALIVEEAILTDASLTNVLSDYSNGEVSLKAPQIVIGTTLIDLGDLAVGATISSEFDIQNVGSDTLEISEIQESSDRLSITEQQSWVVLPGEEISIPFEVFSDTEGSMYETIRFVHNDQPRNPSEVTVQANFFEPNQLKVLAGTNRPGKKDTMWVALENYTDILGVQFEITFPKNFVFEDVFLTRRKQDHSLSFASIDESSHQYRVLSFSPSGAAYTNLTDTLLGFELQTPYQSGSFSVSLSEGLLSDANGNNVASGFQNGIFTLEHDTLSGRISYWADETLGVSRATLSVTSFDSSFSWLNEEDGTFKNIIPSDSQMLGAFRTLQESDREAVSVADIVKLHRSIVGLDSPLKGGSLYVGDVNADTKIDIQDGYYMEQFILRNIDKLPAGNWSILSSGVVSVLPAVTDTSTILHVPRGDTSGIQFTGFLFGDINGSWNEGQSKESLIDGPLSEVETDEVYDEVDNTLEVSIRGEASEAVAGWQASVVFDGNKLDLMEVSSRDETVSYSLFANDKNQRIIKLIWYNLNQPLILSEPFNLVTFHFKNIEGQIDDLISLKDGYELVGVDSKLLAGKLSLLVDNQATDISADNDLPKETELTGTYPNPFNPSTTILYTLNNPERVRLRVYNILGKHVKTLVDKQQSAGIYKVRFDAKNLTSGIYLIFFETKNYQQIKKAVYVK